MELKQILNTENIVSIISDDQKADVSKRVLNQYENDKQSRSDKEEQLEKIVKLALSISDPKAFPWENASNVIYPLIATAATEFGARCYPEVIKDGSIVKAKVYGKDEGKPMKSVAGDVMVDEQGKPILQDAGAKQKRGNRVATYMNWQLSEEVPAWEEGMDKLFHALPVVGMMFKKTFFDGKKTISQVVFPDKLVINNAATCIEDVPVTHIIELYAHQIQERIRKGIFEKFDFDADSISTDSVGNFKTDLSDASNVDGETTVNTDLYVFLEQHTWLDLDEDGFQEPYAITVHKDSGQVVRIVKRFSKKDIEYNSEGEVSEIKAKCIFTPYSFLPSPDGSFYSIGLGHLLYNINQSLNTSINQLIDAGTLQNTGGGFLAKGLKISGGGLKFRPGEYKFVDSFGGAIKDSIVSLPMPEPSQTLFALLGFLAQAGKELGSLRDVLTGDQAGNVQATTMMGLIEQGLKQFKAVYKRIYLSLKGEFKKIYEINSEHLTKEQYAEVLDEPVNKVDVKKDFSEKGFDIVPVADVESITSMQRMAKASFLMQFLNDPYVDQLKLRQEVFNAFHIEDTDKLIVQPPPGPPSAEQTLAEAERTKQEALLIQQQNKTAELMAKFEKAKYEIEEMVAGIAKTESETIKNIADAAKGEKEMQLKSFMAASEALRQDILAEADARYKLAQTREVNTIEQEPSEEMEAENE